LNANLQLSRRLLAAITCSLLAALSLGLPAQRARADEFVIVGSDTLADFLEPIAERFRADHPGLRVRIEAHHSASGPPALLSGRAQLASLSRPMSEHELLAFDARHGRRPIGYRVGIDALAVYVNASNPLDKISLQELDAIYSSTRTCGYPQAIKRWRQLGVKGDIADRTIGAYGYPATSGTYATFRGGVLCGGHFRDGVRVQPGGRSLILSVKESPSSIGYAPRSALIKGVKALRLAVKPGYQYGTLSADDVYNDVYPLTRALYLYRLAPEEADPEGQVADARVVDFLRWVLSEAGQEEIAAAGFLPMPKAVLAETLATLGKAAAK
jgi:phosphate transport system substrate-binding protein